MSFDIHVGIFELGDPHRIPVAVLRERFGKHLGEQDEFRFSPLSFQQGVIPASVHFDDGQTIDGFSVSSPPHDLEFWEVIAGLLGDFPCLLYWGGGAVMGSLEMLQHVPGEFIERLGIPLISTDPERIRRHVGENS